MCGVLGEFLQGLDDVGVHVGHDGKVSEVPVRREEGQVLSCGKSYERGQSCLVARESANRLRAAVATPPPSADSDDGKIARPFARIRSGMVKGVW